MTKYHPVLHSVRHFNWEEYWNQGDSMRKDWIVWEYDCIMEKGGHYAREGPPVPGTPSKEYLLSGGSPSKCECGCGREGGDSPMFGAE